MRLLSLLFLVLFLPLQASATPSAGATGGGGASGLGAGSTPLVIGELLFVGADGEAASVPGSIVDPGTGFISVVNIGSVEVTSTDINGMGTFANNDTGASTINDCSTSNATLTDDSFRIVDIDEGGTSGTIDYDIFEQCLGKTTALDDYRDSFNFRGVNVSSGNRCAAVNPDGNSGGGANQILTGSSIGAQSCLLDLKKDPATGNYSNLYLEQIRCMLPYVPTNFADGECLSLPIYAYDVDGGITDFNDATLLTQVDFAFNGSGDCASSSAEVDCAGFAGPCTASKTINQFVVVEDLSVSDGAGQPDAIAMVYNPAITENTADGGTDVTALDVNCTLWYKN